LDIYITRQRWKLALLIVAVLIGFSSLYITNSLVKELSEEEHKKIALWAEAVKQLSVLTSDNDFGQNFTIISEVIQNNTTVPVILTDEDDNVISYRNIPESRMDTHEEAQRQIAIMKANHQPIEVRLPDNTRNFVYYKESTTLTKLTYYPYIQLAIIILFIVAAYYAFSQSRKSEQNRVWVGMAKETAHQLGTPTSSLLAWVEIVKDSNLSSELVSEFCKDVSRLEKVVDRFSKIGSKPSVSAINLIDVVNNSINYLKNRSSNKISFVKDYDQNDSIQVPLNDTLFEWVLENIAKNAIDAISAEGEVTVKITDNIQVVYIDVTDTGKGVPRSHFKTIFQPGYTTKTRGWGLGLSLSKRIVEEYHNGKIFVYSSELDKGTTFRIVLKKNNGSVV
jgi:signal transduction histidine kinase